MKNKKLYISILLILLALLFINFVFVCIDSTLNGVDKTKKNVEFVNKYLSSLVKENTIGHRKVQKDFYIDKNDTYDFSPYSWDSEGSLSSWRYYNGLMMYALLLNGNYNDYVNNFYSDNINSEGYSNVERNLFNYYFGGEVDTIEFVRPLFKVLDTQNSEKYKKCIDNFYIILSQQKRIEKLGNNFIHKHYNNSWKDYVFSLDGLYMALPFMMEYANKYPEKVNSKEVHRDVYKRMHWVAHHMKNKNGLYNHGCTIKGGLNGTVWLRAVGWYAMAQVDIIELMPEGTHKENMKKDLASFFDTMLIYQNPDNGMWTNVVNPKMKRLPYNKYESGGSAMMAYALLKAYNNGYVPDIKYAQAGLKAFNGIVQNKITGIFPNYKLKDCYLSSKVQEKELHYCKRQLFIKQDAKGIAPLIMASSLVDDVLDKLRENNADVPKVQGSKLFIHPLF